MNLIDLSKRGLIDYQVSISQRGFCWNPIALRTAKIFWFKGDSFFESICWLIFRLIHTRAASPVWTIIVLYFQVRKNNKRRWLRLQTGSYLYDSVLNNRYLTNYDANIKTSVADRVKYLKTCHFSSLQCHNDVDKKALSSANTRFTSCCSLARIQHLSGQIDQTDRSAYGGTESYSNASQYLPRNANGSQVSAMTNSSSLIRSI